MILSNRIDQGSISTPFVPCHQHPSQPHSPQVLRCLNALRYLVLSYMTKTTTMSAMTEIPAKTPRPIGRTDSVLPGIAKAAAADGDDDALEDASAGWAIPETMAVGEEVEEASLEPGAPAEVVAVAPEEVVDEAPVLAAPEAVTAEGVTKVIGTVDSFAAAAELVVAPDGGAVVDDEDPDESVDVAVEPPSVEELELELDPPVPEPPEPEPPLPLLLEVFILKVHDLTSSTAGWPLLSVIGLSVITHVSVIVPTGVVGWLTVVTVVADPAFCLLNSIGTA